MMDADLKQLAERALLIDSVISEQILGLPWEKPPLDFSELTHPSRSEGPTGNSASDSDQEEENFSSETKKKVIELLCQETVRLLFKVYVPKTMNI